MEKIIFHSLFYTKEDIENLISNLKNLKAVGFNTILAEVGTKVKLKCNPEICDGSIDIGHLVELAKRCKNLHLTFIPLVNFLGHQGWQEERNGLLKAYPKFEEVVSGECSLQPVFLNYTPAWCPQTEVLSIIKNVITEIISKTKCEYFHIGMDEVFKIGLCEKCKNFSKGELFVNTANSINEIINLCGAITLMWADRLIPNTLAGSDWAGDALGICESIDKLNKNIVLCDWQYNVYHKNKTNEYLLDKGFAVIPCVWNDSFTTYKTYKQFLKFKDSGKKVLGIMLTNWSLNQNEIADILNNKKVKTDEQMLLKNSFNVFEFFNKQ